MSWGIAETASEIEKIKSESADYLSGLNSCGVIDWNTYNYAFDFYADLLMKAYKQGRKDAQPERQKGEWIYCSPNGFKCSRCGRYIEIECGDVKMNFCPNCRADNRGDRQ